MAMLLPKWKEKKCGNGIAEMGGKKIMAMELPKIRRERERERERENCLDKKNIFGGVNHLTSSSDSYSPSTSEYIV